MLSCNAHVCDALACCLLHIQNGTVNGSSLNVNSLSDQFERDQLEWERLDPAQYA